MDVWLSVLRSSHSGGWPFATFAYVASSNVSGFLLKHGSRLEPETTAKRLALLPLSLRDAATLASSASDKLHALVIGSSLALHDLGRRPRSAAQMFSVSTDSPEQDHVKAVTRREAAVKWEASGCHIQNFLATPNCARRIDRDMSVVFEFVIHTILAIKTLATRQALALPHDYPPTRTICAHTSSFLLPEVHSLQLHRAQSGYHDRVPLPWALRV